MSWEPLLPRYVPELPDSQLMRESLANSSQPVMDGITCVKRIRELQEEGKIKRHVPVIAVTANARKDQIMMSLNAGMVSPVPLFSFAWKRGSSLTLACLRSGPPLMRSPKMR